MNIQGWAEIVVTIGLSIALGWPLGIYMARVWQDQPTWLSPVMRPVETVFYRLSGVDKDKGPDGAGLYAVVPRLQRRQLRRALC